MSWSEENDTTTDSPRVLLRGFPSLFPCSGRREYITLSDMFLSNWNLRVLTIDRRVHNIAPYLAKALHNCKGRFKVLWGSNWSAKIQPQLRLALNGSFQ